LSKLMNLLSFDVCCLLHFIFISSFFYLFFFKCIGNISKLILQKTLKLRKKIRSLVKFRSHLINGANFRLDCPINIGEISIKYSIYFSLAHLLSVYNKL
jgi:hypothetical protein